MNPDLYIGMISGTSRDGADAALVRFDGDRPDVISALCAPYPPGLADILRALVETAQRPSAEASAHIDRQLADHFAQTALSLMKTAAVRPEQVAAIGSHGQTVWHDPDGPLPETVQLGDPERIAAITGIPTVGDFRSADLLAGGQGAPLAPLIHRALFSPQAISGPSTRVVVNLGGIANISAIEASGKVYGFDTGPANCLMDGWIREHRGSSYDRNGEWAASGHVSRPLLEELLCDPYFRQSPPKSTGVEYFNSAWLEPFLDQSTQEPADIQATLAELTAVTVAQAILPFEPADVYACGGGTHNRHLLRRLEAHLSGIPLRSTADLGLEPDWVEAVLFAWLARERLAARPQDTRSITGADRPVLLGKIFGRG